MPIENLGKNHFTAAEKTQLDDAVNAVLNSPPETGVDHG